MRRSGSELKAFISSAFQQRICGRFEETVLDFFLALALPSLLLLRQIWGEIPNTPEKSSLILKDIPWDTLELRLDTEDTKHLEQPGDYVYDIQITLNDGTVDTFIERAKLKITEEVD